MILNVAERSRSSKAEKQSLNLPKVIVIVSNLADVESSLGGVQGGAGQVSAG